MNARFIWGTALIVLSGCANGAGHISGAAIECHSVDKISYGEASGRVRSYCGYFLGRSTYFLLYGSKQSYESDDVSNAISVKYSDCYIIGGTDGIEPLNGTLVVVEGALHKDSYDTNGFAKGRIDGVVKLSSDSYRVTCSRNHMNVEIKGDGGN